MLGIARSHRFLLSSESHYDFGARIYDGRIGRWLAVDPLAGKYPDLSAYCFVGNMPIFAIDPDGKKIVIHYINDSGRKRKVKIKDYEDISKLIEHENNFVRITAENLINAYDLESTKVIESISMRKKIDIFHTDEDSYSYKGDVYYNPEISYKLLTIEAAEQLYKINQEKMSVSTIELSTEKIKQVEKKSNDYILNNNVYLETSENNTPDEVIIHELDHALFSIIDPYLHEYLRNQDNKNYLLNNWEEERVILASEAIYRIKNGKEPRRMHFGIPEGKTITDLGIGKGGQNEVQKPINKSSSSDDTNRERNPE